RAPRRAGTGGQRGNGDQGDEHAGLPRGSELAHRGESRLHRASLLGQVVQRLEAPVVLLLVEQALLDVALDHAAIEVLHRNLVLLFSHFGLLRIGAGACSTPFCYRTAVRSLPRGAYAIVDGSAGRPPLDLVSAFVQGGAAVVQLRLKQMGAGELLK